MNTSLSWLKAYVPDLDVTAQEYTDAMTLSGTKVEGYEKLDADLDKIVIGQIDKIEKHPDADKLIICQVNIGTESVQIVTGAPNVKEGDKVKAGDLLADADLEFIKETGRNSITPIVIGSSLEGKDLVCEEGEVQAGKTVIMEIKQK
mgnify:CR=1 FL=1